MKRRDFLKASVALSGLPFIALESANAAVAPIKGASPRRFGPARIGADGHLSVRADYLAVKAIDHQLHAPTDEKTWASLLYLEDAAAWNQPFAMWLLSTRYREGWRAPVNLQRAQGLCERAAQEGELMAHVELLLRSDRVAADAFIDGFDQAFHLLLSLNQLDDVGLWFARSHSYYAYRDLIRRAERTLRQQGANGLRWYTSVMAEPMAGLAKWQMEALIADRKDYPSWQLLRRKEAAGVDLGDILG